MAKPRLPRKDASRPNEAQGAGGGGEGWHLMKMRNADNGTIYHALGDLRIAGPTEEVEPFLEWLKEQDCRIYGFDDIKAPTGLRAVDMSINIFPKEGCDNMKPKETAAKGASE